MKGGGGALRGGGGGHDWPIKGKARKESLEGEWGVGGIESTTSEFMVRDVAEKGLSWTERYVPAKQLVSSRTRTVTWLFLALNAVHLSW